MEHRYDQDMMSVKHGGLISRYTSEESADLKVGDEVNDFNEEEDVNEFDLPLDLKWDPVHHLRGGKPLYVPDPFISTKVSNPPTSSRYNLRLHFWIHRTSFPISRLTTLKGSELNVLVLGPFYDAVSHLNPSYNLLTT